MPESYRTAKQHPVPQNIMNVEFKLVGELTIKQFGYVAVAAVAAFIIYKSGIYFIWRWLLILISLGLGVGMAFVPIQDRGLDVWIKSLVKALFSPVIMVWRKEPGIPRFMEIIDEFLAEAPPISTENVRLERKLELTDILARIESADEDPLEEKRRNYLRGLDFNTNVGKQEPEPVIAEVVGTSNLSPERRKEEKYLYYEEKDKKREKHKSDKDKPPQKHKKEPTVPKEQPSKTKVKRDEFVKEKPFPKKSIKEKNRSIFNIKPNIIHGTIYSKEGKLLEGAVIMIKDMDDDPVRALKTNALGRFVITTPLPNGKYKMSVRKGDQSFDTINLELKGEKLAPLKIKAKG